MDNQERQDLQARATALQIALRQSDSQAIAHLEAVVSALLLSLEPPQRSQVISEAEKLEALPPEAATVVELQGEMAPGEIPQRQAWRDELTALQTQLGEPELPPNEPTPQPTEPEAS